MPVSGGPARTARSGLLEVGGGPDLLAQVLPHLADVLHSGRRAPAPGEPAPHVAPGVALGGLAPPAFHRGLGEDDALVDAPLAGGPPQDLLGGAGEAAVDARRDQLVGAGSVALEEDPP